MYEMQIKLIKIGPIIEHLCYSTKHVNQKSTRSVHPEQDADVKAF